MLAHVIYLEDSRARLWLLRRYARREVLLLGLFYRLLNSRAICNRVFSEMVFWTVGYPSARWGIAGTPMSPREIEEFFEGENQIAVGPCRCRTAHRGCGHPMETDIVVRTGFPVWSRAFAPEYRQIDAGEAVEICRKSHQQGLAQISYAHLDVAGGGSMFVVCNCCADGCLPLLAMKHYGNDRYPMHRGVHRASIESVKCEGCAKCVEICPFGARYMGQDGKSRVENCFGCGLCASHCPSGASLLV